MARDRHHPRRADGAVRRGRSPPRHRPDTPRAMATPRTSAHGRPVPRRDPPLGAARRRSRRPLLDVLLRRGCVTGRVPHRPGGFGRRVVVAAPRGEPARGGRLRSTRSDGAGERGRVADVLHGDRGTRRGRARGGRGAIRRPRPLVGSARGVPRPDGGDRRRAHRVAVRGRARRSVLSVHRPGLRPPRRVVPVHGFVRPAPLPPDPRAGERRSAALRRGCERGDDRCPCGRGRGRRARRLVGESLRMGRGRSLPRAVALG